MNGAANTNFIFMQVNTETTCHRDGRDVARRRGRAETEEVRSAEPQSSWYDASNAVSKMNATMILSEVVVMELELSGSTLCFSDSRAVCAKMPRNTSAPSSRMASDRATRWTLTAGRACAPNRVCARVAQRAAARLAQRVVTRPSTSMVVSHAPSWRHLTMSLGRLSRSRSTARPTQLSQYQFGPTVRATPSPTHATAGILGHAAQVLLRLCAKKRSLHVSHLPTALDTLPGGHGVTCCAVHSLPTGHARRCTCGKGSNGAVAHKAFATRFAEGPPSS